MKVDDEIVGAAITASKAAIDRFMLQASLETPEKAARMRESFRKGDGHYAVTVSIWLQADTLTVKWHDGDDEAGTILFTADKLFG